ncbi:sodium/hydrogen antiporter [Sporothrix schenckii ATCC 58251]|uniref:Sodium/hydrogen antiporter n=1 Tax=Sporothrix schenckii (strain ATCC 58251 / de Perez 2211183) TaxID=1391915 RepID=U7PSY0_SPOS1|nr:sodium/hydrogen antiporter [Sporothrix schenckii ATCC 58251]
MAWAHLSITKPHLVYIILGGFTSLFMLCSSIIKERIYIGEATVATLCGLIFGPHAADLIDPASWGNVDIVTIEFSRIVLVVQCFAVGVELPKFYMERHWKSVIFLLVPVMTFGWLVTSLFVWWMVPPLDWLDSLVIAACVTATDPVLASSVVGKGKFAKRVPKHLRDLLSAESGCNDGMAFPFIYLSLYLIQDKRDAGEVSFHWIVYTILYECIFGAIYGFLIGYIARHGIKFAERHDLIDRESFLVFYFVLALFCAGSGSILGVDDLLVGFSCGVGFSNDGWFGHKTEESHVSNVIDLLLNLTYFVYLGTIIPWEMFNDTSIGLSAWRLTIIAIFVILFRRIPIMLALKPLIPDIKTWREALFAGHFGPIGVGAIFVAIMARAELESDSPIIVEDEDGEVVKTYELPPQRGDKDGGGSDMVSHSLKYMGMGGLVRPSEKANEQGNEKTKGSNNDADPMTRVSSRPAMPSWINFGRTGPGEPSTQRQRKKSVAEVQEEEDDRHIRFTIGGVGQRMTKEGFIKQMQQLDQSTRREVVDKSSASHTIKTLAKQDIPLPDIVVSHPDKSAKAGSATSDGQRRRRGKEVGGNDGSGEDDSSSRRSSASQLETATISRRGRAVAGPSDNTDDIPETAVERRRRLAVLQSVSDDDDEDSDEGNDETNETPAERRRREAALGMSSHQAEDSDDDDTPRVPPARRGIRFADTPDRRKT